MTQEFIGTTPTDITPSGDFRVNTGEPQAIHQQITALSNGGFVVTWESHENADGSSDIRGRVYGADGTAAGDDFLINTSITEDYQYEPQITALSGGGFVVTWTSNESATGSDIRGRVYGPDGVAAGGDFLINTSTVSAQRAPQITALGDGGFVVVWESDDDGAGDIRGRVFGADGTPAGDDFRVNTPAETEQFGPQITALNGGGFVVTWTSDGGEEIGFDIRGRVFDADGVARGDDFLVNTTTELRQGSAQITALLDGGFVVTWTSDGGEEIGFDIRGRVFDADGVARGDDFLINTTTESNQDGAQITALSDGGFAVTWRSDEVSGFGQIRGRVFDADGTAWDDDFLVNAAAESDHGNPQIMALSGGGFAITWDSFELADNTYDIRARIYAADGTAVGDQFLVNTTTESNQNAPQFTALSDDRFVVTWESHERGFPLGDIRAIVLSLPGVNDAPTAVALSNAVVAENAPAGTVVGTLSGTDPDVGQSQTLVFSLDDPSGNFEIINGNQLVVRSGAVLDFEGTNTFAVDVTATDTGGLATTEAFNIALTNVDEAPSGGVSIERVRVGANRATLTASNTIADPDGITVPVSYQWRYSTDGGATWADIDGATSASFTPRGIYARALIQVAAVYSDPFGSHVLTSSETAVVGDVRSNTLTGTAGKDYIVGLGRDDTIVGFRGADVVNGGSGTDTIELRATSSDLNGAADSQIVAVESVSAAAARRGVTIDLSNQSEGFTIIGSRLGDVIEGTAAADVIRAGRGNDTIIGFTRGDGVDGGGGRDTLELSATSSGLNRAHDRRVVSIEIVTAAQATSDVAIDLRRQSEGFTVIGSAHNDVLTGSRGPDLLFGGAGNDRLSGGPGADTVTGGPGNDTLSGGSDQDVFVFEPGFGNDRISDFDANRVGGQDHIDLSAYGFTAAEFARRVVIQDIGSSVLVTIDGTDSILLSDVSGSGRDVVNRADFLL